MNRLFKIIFLIMLIPSLAYGLRIVGAGVNTSAPFPIVTTNAATAILGTSATLNGTAYNYNSAGNSFFNYGLTSSYGSQTSLTAFTANTVTTSFSGNATGLSIGNIYHFQACVSNSAGVACGSDLTFTTTFTGGMTRLAALTLPADGPATYGLAIDNVNKNLYICHNANPPAISKVQLSDFTYVSTLFFAVTGKDISCQGLVVNPAGTQIVVGSNCSIGSCEEVIKVDIPSFTSISSANMNATGIRAVGYDTGSNVYATGGGLLFKNPATLGLGITNSDATSQNSIDIDNTNSFVYSNDRASTTLKKYNLSLVLQASQNSNYNCGDLSSFHGDFDYTGGNLYMTPGFGGCNTVGIDVIGKLNLAGFTLSNIATAVGSNVQTVAVDSTTAYYYHDACTNPAKLYSRKLSNDSAGSSLTLNAGENCLGYNGIAIDTAAHVLYGVTAVGSSPIVIKVKLN